MTEKARENGVEMVLDLQPDLGEVVLDPQGVYRCILNLVGNAVDASDKDEGAVKLGTRARLEDGMLDITVADNGCGISEDDLKQLFKVFFSTKGSNGTGLGLAVTQKIIKEHGGDIQVESELSVGTQFTITLPLKQPQ